MSVRMAPLQPDEWNHDVINALSYMVTPHPLLDSALPPRLLQNGTKAALSEHLDEHQRMNLVFTIGSHDLLGLAFNTFGVHIDDDTEQQER